jgi:threonine/homoserine/homoserine lactone efflux protein
MDTSFTIGIVLGLAAGLTPGPLLALTIAQTLKYGIAEGMKVAMAPLVTDAPIVILALWLLFSMRSADIILGVLSLAGCLYISYLALENLRAKPVKIEGVQTAPRSLTKAVVANALNPSPYLFWMTVGGPLILRQGNERIAPAISFLVFFYLCLVGSKIVLSLITGRFKDFLTGRLYLFILRALGIALLFFAVLLLKDALMFFHIPVPW